MSINKADFIRGGLIGLVIILLAYLLFASSLLSSTWNIISNDTISLFISAFLGGFSAGIFTYYFNSKSRVNELRHTKYFENRNTIVQIEHELLGTRVDLSRDIESIEAALEVKNERYRFILRFFNLNISSGLSLRLLDLDFINKYSEVYIIFQSINSDMEYLQGIVTQIRESIDMDKPQPTSTTISLMNNYIMLLEHTYRNLLKADEMSLELVALCQVALAEKPEIKLKEYIKKGGEIKYSISKSQIDNKIRKISSQENKPSSEDNPRPQFVALYFDLIRVVLPTSLL